MSRKLTLLKILADGKFHSGETLARTLGISRTAVWKQVRKLKEYDIDIFSVTGKGYRLDHVIDLFDREAIVLALADPPACRYEHLEVFLELDSTNQYLMERLSAGSVHRHIILAEYQSAGKGRRGRRWLSPLANGIYMSIGWRFDTQPEALQALSLATGVAIADVLTEFTEGVIGLKWPNDILYNNKKMGGILIESRGETAGPCDVIVGIGINVTLSDHMASLIDQPATDLSHNIHAALSRNKLATAIIKRTIAMLEEFDVHGFAPFIEQWRKYDLMQGKRADLILPNVVYTGDIIGIDHKGLLMMSIDGEKKTFGSGELSLRIAT